MTEYSEFDKMSPRQNPGKVNVPDHRRFFDELAERIKAYLYDDSVNAATDPLGLVHFYSLLDFPARFLDITHNLDLDEAEATLVLVLASHMQRRGVCAWRTDSRMFGDTLESLDSATDSLLERGLVIAMPDESEIDKRSQLGLPILLSADIFGILFQGLEYCVNFSVGLSAQGRIVRCDDIASRTLYYDAGTQEEVNRLLAALFADRFGAIMDRLSQRGRRRTMSCLLYGPPGTGKTELALQIARSTGRNIVQADIAKMTGTYVGESERNYRSLFTAYRYAAKVMVITPILLLNEADSFLSRRVHVSRSTDKYENNLQNILLEELESFEGILMATTNHTEGIDDAFDRRFFMKVEIGVPGRDTRLRIWQDVMPALSTDEVSLLADGFVLSGAQISNVATRYDFIVVLEDRNPSFSELVDLCRAEENRATGQRRNKIGFGKVIGSK